jgi:hypothetical protein
MRIVFTGASMTEAQTQTGQPPWEKIWAILQETAQQQKEWRKEYEQRQKEYEQQRKKSAQELDEIKGLQKEATLWQKEIDRQQERTGQYVRELSRQMGLLHNSFGELAEHMVSPSILEKFNALGYTFDKVSPNVKIHRQQDSIPGAEIDILLENGDIAIVIEVKAKPAYKDIDQHVKRMEVVRRWADRNNDRRKFYGAIAGAIMSDEVKRSILNTGFYLIEQTGDTVAINIPDSFVPREW